MGKRLEDAPAVARGSLDDALVDQEQENCGCMPERHARPVVRPAEVVFQVQADVPVVSSKSAARCSSLRWCGSEPAARSRSHEVCKRVV